MRLLRRNGLTVPEAPTVSDMTSHISSLQVRARRWNYFAQAHMEALA